MKKLLFFLLVLVMTALPFTEVSHINSGPVRAIDGVGEVVYAGVGGSLNIYNIYRRDFPQLMYTMPGLSSNIQDIIVDEGRKRLYLLAEKEGLFILDIEEPYRPEVTGHIGTGEGKVYAMDFDGGDKLYIGGTSFVSEVIVSDPSEIKVKKSVNLPGKVESLDYHNGRLYLALGDKGLVVLGTFQEESFVYMGVQTGTYSLVEAYGNNILYGRLDKPGEDEPRLFNQIFTFAFYHPVTAEVKGNVIYSGGMNNFAIYKLSEETSTDPKLVWNLPNMPTLDCVLKDKNIYLANDFQGISVFNVEDITAPEEIGRIKTLGRGEDVFVYNNILYIPSGLSGTARYDITDIDHPVQLAPLPTNLKASYDIAEYAGDIYVLGVRGANPSTVVVERLDPIDLVIEDEYEITEIAKPENISTINIAEGYAIITLGNGTMHVLSSEFESIATVTEDDAQFYQTVIRDGFLYASDFHGTYHIYRLSRETMPEWVSSITTFDEGGNGFALKDDYLYTADATNGLSVIDISNPKEPYVLTSYPTVWGMDVEIDGNIAYLADGRGRLKAFDISDPSVLVVMDTLAHAGYFTDISIYEGHIIANDIYNGIYTYRTLETDEPLAKAGLEATPQQYGITGNYPNPFNSATDINIVLPERADVDFSIYNVRGEKVETLIKETLPAGAYNMTWQPGNLPSGVYMAVLSTPSMTWKREIKFVK